MSILLFVSEKRIEWSDQVCKDLRIDETIILARKNNCLIQINGHTRFVTKFECSLTPGAYVRHLWFWSHTLNVSNHLDCASTPVFSSSDIRTVPPGQSPSQSNFLTAARLRCVGLSRSISHWRNLQPIQSVSLIAEHSASRTGFDTYDSCDGLLITVTVRHSIYAPHPYPHPQHKFPRLLC